MMKILLATNNKHKLEEIKLIFDIEIGDTIQLLTPADLNLELDVPENENTLEGNAYLKAKAFFDASGIPSIADDTGLEIDALDGQPGVRSARFAGEPANDAKNREKVLALMNFISTDRRSARFRTVICYYDSTGKHLIEGSCEGQITKEEAGYNGFGYDCIFIPDGYSLTFAEMKALVKNSISHRSKAIINFVRWLKENNLK
jgi:XTP/dITP diphosphohydrolase